MLLFLILQYRRCATVKIGIDVLHSKLYYCRDPSHQKDICEYLLWNKQ